MSRRNKAVGAVALAAILVVAACADTSAPWVPQEDPLAPTTPHAPQALRAWFDGSAPEILAMPRTVFAAHDESANQLVFGVEDAGMFGAVRDGLMSRGVPASAYRIEVTEPIHFASTTLRTAHRPTVGGIQIHFSNFLCTLGFNVDHGGGRSFITNSHCTDQQGSTGNTTYFQPTSSVAPDAIGVEAHDPAYFRGGACPGGRRCRFSDAARVLYNSGTDSDRGAIAKTTGANNGDLTVAGSFTVANQDNSSTTFSGTMNKVGRTTGWTSGNVTNTCATVNVSGSNITLLCQTLVRASQQIVAGGDSGSPVFTTGSGDNVTLVGILWGGSSSGDLFVFSPFKNIQDELGAMTATASGDPPPPDDGDGSDDDDGACVPRGPHGNNCK